MNKKKLCFFLAVIAVAFCCDASARLQQDVVENEPASIESVSPVLAGIKKIYIIVEPVAVEKSGGYEVWWNRQKRIENKLKQAGFEIAKGVRLGKGIRQMDIPELRVSTDMIEFGGSGMYVFRTQVSLAAKVYLERGVGIKAELWKSEPAMKPVPAEKLAAVMTDTVLEQVESFVHSCIRARSAVRARPRAALVGSAKQDLGHLAGKTTAVKYLYTASKNSRVFHSPECSSAKRISPKNLVGYSSRDAVVKSGKRPCKRCQP